MILEVLKAVTDFSAPYPYILFLLMVVGAQICGMIKGPQKHRSDKTIAAYREVGGEIFFVFLPFVFYSGLTLLDGSFLAFLSGVELPMASVILLGMLILCINKGLEAADGKYLTGRFVVLRKFALTLLITCLFFVAWLFYQDELWPWFSVINLFIVVVVMCLAFGVIAAINRMVKAPEEVGLEPSK